MIDGAVGGTTSIMFTFEPNANLPIKLFALSMALDSIESMCAVMLVGLLLGGLKSVASGAILCIAGSVVFVGGGMVDDAGFCGG